MAIGDQDGAVFFRDGDSAVVVGGDSNGACIKGHFRLVDSVESFGIQALAGEIKGTPTFEYWSASAPAGFIRGQVISINAQQYKLRTDPMAKGDGKISVVNLQVVETT
jgi:hypothetical protein